MFKKIARWLGSKTGKQTIAGILAAVIIMAVVGQLVGLWDFRNLFGTVIPPVPFPAPVGGYTCLPTCEVDDGMFMDIAGMGQNSFAGTKLVTWIAVPADYTSVELSIFDGDSGKDQNGNIVAIWTGGGHWDDTQEQLEYTLYADRYKNGAADGIDTQVGKWYGNDQNPTSGPNWTASSATMPDNGWYTLNIVPTEEAKAPSGHYFYRLEIYRSGMGGGNSAFKLRSTAYLITGKAQEAGAGAVGVALAGMGGSVMDIPILYPQNTLPAGTFQPGKNYDTWNGTLTSQLGPSNYIGDWDLYIYVPTDTQTLSIWNGDFDRGTSSSVAQDTDDPETPNTVPSFAVQSVTRPEQGWGKGAPPDNHSTSFWRRGVPVTYSILDPNGQPIYTDPEPSGTEEWEDFIVTTSPTATADVRTSQLGPGFYDFHITGLDLHNYVVVRTDAEICDNVNGCGPCVSNCGAACPRTIGYWKNNFNKLFGDGKGAAQETTDSLTKALKVLGEVSPLYRHGINVQNPQPLPVSAGPLTAGEALMILMRKDVTLKDGTNIAYPGGRNQYQSMLARALQQDLAAWLNFTSTKLGEFMYINISLNGSTIYEGSLIYGLRAAQQTIFTYGSNMSAPELEWAKDVGDQINNGNMGESAPEASCETNPGAYVDKIPQDKQPPKPENAKKAPKPPKGPKPTPVPQPEPATCGPRVNTYGVEVTNNPFYGIKFNYQSGTEIKNGDGDEFRFTLPTSALAGMTSVQMEAKAGQIVEVVTLQNCQFEMGQPCDTVSANYALSFAGSSVDAANGTTTLVFSVQNFTSYGLSHVTISLPAGATPTPSNGNYESQVCPTP